MRSGDALYTFGETSSLRAVRNPEVEIAVVGAGLAGLSLALFLQAQGVRVEVPRARAVTRAPP